MNEKRDFQTASLFKAPLVMAYYKKERLGIKNDLIIVATDDMIDQRYRDMWKIGAGARVSVADAVKIALRESDNIAIHIVASQADQGDLFSDCGIVYTTKRPYLLCMF